MLSLHRVRWAPCPLLVLQAGFKVSGVYKVSLSQYHQYQAATGSSYLALRRWNRQQYPTHCCMFVPSLLLHGITLLSVEFTQQTFLQLSPVNSVALLFFCYSPVVKVSISFPYSALDTSLLLDMQLTNTFSQCVVYLFIFLTEEKKEFGDKHCDAVG